MARKLFHNARFGAAPANDGSLPEAACQNMEHNQAELRLRYDAVDRP